jgi:hypothetical protein
MTDDHPLTTRGLAPQTRNKAFLRRSGVEFALGEDANDRHPALTLM